MLMMMDRDKSVMSAYGSGNPRHMTALKAAQAMFANASPPLPAATGPNLTGLAAVLSKLVSECSNGFLALPSVSGLSCGQSTRGAHRI